jgi:hypothetical protein
MRLSGRTCIDYRRIPPKSEALNSPNREPSRSNPLNRSSTSVGRRAKISGFGERFVTAPVGGHGLAAAQAVR